MNHVQSKLLSSKVPGYPGDDSCCGLSVANNLLPQSAENSKI